MVGSFRYEEMAVTASELVNSMGELESKYSEIAPTLDQIDELSARCVQPGPMHSFLHTH